MTMMHKRRTFLLGFGAAAAALATKPVTAEAALQALPIPTGKVVLTVSGKITNTNAGTTAVFDMPSLEGIGLTSFTTGTPWDPGKTNFQGVLLDTLMQRVGAHGKTAVAYALNDYSVELPISDFSQYGTLLATKMNGKYMPVADKGPLFVVYPFDSRPSLQRQTFYGRSVWQLNRLVIA
jgi:hypothetical protein